ncbi:MULTISPECIES: DUF4097 family beta strand repeat-containing protein [Thermocrispum]|jgi:hypothetical protein|uniref:DUF4097 family beta strand repeat-containing protein n=1 Tax=Thermocrispum TaxID=37924 RepID=UPI00048B4F32|nr:MULTISPECIES: DUF4097 family beta strand repeat-containing protein [Thermocrispum]
MTAPEDAIRTTAFTTEGPVRIEVQLSAGSVDVELADSGSTGGEDGVQVDVRHAPEEGMPWAQMMASALTWVNEQFGEHITADVMGTATAAVDQTRVELVGDRLIVQSPKTLPMRHQPLAVTVRAPAGSELDIRTSSASVTVTGTAASAVVTTSSGDISVDRVSGSANIRTASGTATVGAVSGTSSIVTGSGSVHVGELDDASGKLTLRSGSGDLTVSGAAAGALTAKTGSGDVRLELADGVLAEIHLSSGSGRVSSELDVQHDPPEQTAPLRINARSGHGSVTVAGPRK